MRKFILKAAMVAAFAVVAGYGVYANQEEEITLSETAMANIEALARGEGGGSTVYCCGNSGECMKVWMKRGR